MSLFDEMMHEIAESDPRFVSPNVRTLAEAGRDLEAEVARLRGELEAARIALKCHSQEIVAAARARDEAEATLAALRTVAGEAVDAWGRSMPPATADRFIKAMARLRAVTTEG